MNNAYSAIATVPGAFVPPNQQGWNQVVYIRGGNFDQIGYEFDGVPVNRSFDNYPGSTAGTLGQQELQVYAGGGTVGQSASGLAGFINQVIKTGTYPGYATVSGGIGTPTYYHNLQFEAGGATPDRLFSYYVGIGGYNQDFRYLDQFNGSNLGDVWGYPIIAYNTTNLFFGGVYPECGYTPPAGSGFLQRAESRRRSTIHSTIRASGTVASRRAWRNLPGCYQTLSPAYATLFESQLPIAKSSLNFHFGIPHKHDAGRDDVQVLYNIIALQSQYYSSLNDIGPTSSRSSTRLLRKNGSAFLVRLHHVAGRHDLRRKSKRRQSRSVLDAEFADDRCANITPYISTVRPIPGACPAGTWSTVPSDSRDAFGTTRRSRRFSTSTTLVRTPTSASTAMRFTPIGCRRAR